MTRVLLTVGSWVLSALFFYAAGNPRRAERRNIAHWEGRGYRLKNAGRFKRKDAATVAGIKAYAVTMLAAEIFLWHPLVQVMSREFGGIGFAFGLFAIFGLSASAFAAVKTASFSEADNKSFGGADSTGTRDTAMVKEPEPLVAGTQHGSTKVVRGADSALAEVAANGPAEKGDAR